MLHVSLGLWQIGNDPYFSCNQERNDVIWIFIPAMLLAHVFSPVQGAHCGPADKHLGVSKFFYLPTVVQENCFKMNIEIYINPYPANVENMVRS
jgi:hypothetical protein